MLNVGDLMISIREALAPGGRFVVRVPYKDNMLQYARLNGCDYDMVHLRNFAEDNLKHLLTQSGFVVEHLHYDGFNARSRAPVGDAHPRRQAAVPRVRVLACSEAASGWSDWTRGSAAC